MPCMCGEWVCNCVPTYKKEEFTKKELKQMNKKINAFLSKKFDCKPSRNQIDRHIAEFINKIKNK